MDIRQSSSIPLGRSGLRVSPIGVGTNAWSSRRTKVHGLRETFDAALSAGITFFDTAEIYTLGGSERAVGRSIKAGGPDPGGRVPVVLTKFFPMPWRLRRQALASALRRSLKRLQMPRADVYILHYPSPPVPIETWVDALADAAEAGLARAIGVSNFDAPQMRRAHAVLAKRGIALACNEVEYSLLKRDPETNGVLAACRELGITLIAYRPLALGLLSGKYTAESPPKGWRGLLYRRGYVVKIKPVFDLLRRIGEERGGKTPSQVALNWTICKGTLPIPGATSVKHVHENAGALGWRLADAEIASLEAAEEKLRRG